MPGWRAAWWSVKMPSKASDGGVSRPEEAGLPQMPFAAPNPGLWRPGREREPQGGLRSHQHQRGGVPRERRHVRSYLRSWGSWARGAGSLTHRAGRTAGTAGRGRGRGDSPEPQPRGSTPAWDWLHCGTQHAMQMRSPLGKEQGGAFKALKY